MPFHETLEAPLTDVSFNSFGKKFLRLVKLKTWKSENSWNDLEQKLLKGSKETCKGTGSFSNFFVHFVTLK